MMAEKPAHFSIVNKAIVDGEQWYTVTCSKEASIWFRETQSIHEDKLWFNEIDPSWIIRYNRYDMSEKMYLLLALRWG